MKILLFTGLTALIVSTQADAYAQNNSQDPYESVRSASKDKRLKEIALEANTKWQQDSTYAVKNKIPFSYSENGVDFVLIGLNSDKSPSYMQFMSQVQNATTSARHVHSTGYKNLNLEGGSVPINFGIWDQTPETSHPEFGSRLTLGNNSLPNDGNHGTRVAGVILAGGNSQFAKGAAPNLSATAYTIQNDIGEMSQVANSMLISNHSYGGYFYLNQSLQISMNQMDEIMYNAPYYLTVAAMGNTATDFMGYPAGNKNTLGVSNICALPQGFIRPNEVSIDATSSYGPVESVLGDGFRIKPDVCSQGLSWAPSHDTNLNPTYQLSQGTSFSAPSVSGSLALVQERYYQQNQQFMTSSALRALACHTADDAGLPGPDPYFGYGVVNVVNAIEHIDNKGCGNIDIQNHTLQSGNTIVIPVAITAKSFKATMAWLDPISPVDPALTDQENAYEVWSLNNDLDIVLVNVLSGVEYHPFVLDQTDPQNIPAHRGDNDFDNVLQISFSPILVGDYELRISHEGTLQTGSQDFALVTGSLDVIIDDYDWNNLGFIEASIFSSNGYANSGIQWTGPNGFTSNSLDIYNLEQGDYVLEVTSAEGCVSTKFVDLKCVRPGCSGDYNGDGIITSTDFTYFLADYGQPCNDDVCYTCPGDMDKDGEITAVDLSFFLGDYGLSCADIPGNHLCLSYKSSNENRLVHIQELEDADVSFNSEIWSFEPNTSIELNHNWYYVSNDYGIVRVHSGDVFSMKGIHYKKGDKLLHLIHDGDSPSDETKLEIIELDNLLEGKDQLLLYPNPSSDYINIASTSGGLESYDIIDVATGKIVQNGPLDGNESQTIMLDPSAMGNYIVRAVLSSGKTLEQNFVRK